MAGWRATVGLAWAFQGLFLCNPDATEARPEWVLIRNSSGNEVCGAAIAVLNRTENRPPARNPAYPAGLSADWLRYEVTIRPTDGVRPVRFLPDHDVRPDELRARALDALGAGRTLGDIDASSMETTRFPLPVGSGSMTVDALLEAFGTGQNWRTILFTVGGVSSYLNSLDPLDHFELFLHGGDMYAMRVDPWLTVGKVMWVSGDISTRTGVTYREECVYRPDWLVQH